jgi:AraC-like DNA-binding protein
MRDSADVTADPFSDVLALADARSVVSGGFAAGGRWALRFPVPEQIKFFGVVTGGCWLRVDRAKAPVRLEAGDVFLPWQVSFVLASDLTAPQLDARKVFPPNGSTTARLGSGDGCFVLGGHVKVDAVGTAVLAEVLPPLIHVRAGSRHATVVQWILEQLAGEREAPLPGATIASAQLAQLMFLHILRAQLETAGALDTGWLRAAGDKRLAPVLQRMHADPRRAWHLGELAKAAAMSRTSFAEYFRRVAGVAPLTYLMQWRMRLAQRALRDDDSPISALAHELGYASESAFSNAFKRVVGIAPNHYRSAVRDTSRRGIPQLPEASGDVSVVGVASRQDRRRSSARRVAGRATQPTA